MLVKVVNPSIVQYPDGVVIGKGLLSIANPLPSMLLGLTHLKFVGVLDFIHDLTRLFTHLLVGMKSIFQGNKWSDFAGEIHV